MQLLLTQGVCNVDVADSDGRTALHHAADSRDPELVQGLLEAGASPIIRNNNGRTPLDRADDPRSIALLQAAMAESERARLLLKARALIEAAHSIPATASDALNKGLSLAAAKRETVEAAPAYVRTRMASDRELPDVAVQEGGNERLAGCLMYAVGLKGGGGVHEGEGPTPKGMVKDVFGKLLELVVPVWDPARKGLPLGEGF